MVSAALTAGVAESVIRPAGSQLAFGQIGNGRICVELFLNGGPSLNIAPLSGLGAYRDWMSAGNILPNSTLALDSVQFLHPALTRLHSRYLAGQMLVLNLVGLDGESRSHETNVDRKLSGLISMSVSQREMGIGARAACLDQSNPIAAVSISGDGMWSEGVCNPPISLNNLSNLGENQFQGWQPRHDHFKRARDTVAAQRVQGPSPREQVVLDGIRGVDEAFGALRNFQNTPTGVTFPTTGLGNQLRDVARVIIGERGTSMRTNLFFTSQGGYDTHSNEVNSLTNLLGTLDAAVDAFFRAMELNGLANEVVMLIDGDFARTASNGSGTDHGGPGTVFVLGAGVNGGRVGTPAATASEITGRQYIAARRLNHISMLSQFYEGWLALPRGALFPDTALSDDVNVSMFR